MRHNFLALRAVRAWPSLPRAVVQPPSLKGSQSCVAVVLRPAAERCPGSGRARGPFQPLPAQPLPSLCDDSHSDPHPRGAAATAAASPATPRVPPGLPPCRHRHRRPRRCSSPRRTSGGGPGSAGARPPSRAPAPAAPLAAAVRRRLWGRPSRACSGRRCPAWRRGWARSACAGCTRGSRLWRPWSGKVSAVRTPLIPPSPAGLCVPPCAAPHVSVPFSPSVLALQARKKRTKAKKDKAQRK